MQFHLLPLVAVSILAAATHADTLDVCQSGCTYSSIQDAINAASNGDRIEIGPGTYYENLQVGTPDLTIVGLAGHELTFVDSQRSGRSQLQHPTPSTERLLQALLQQLPTQDPAGMSRRIEAPPLAVPSHAMKRQ